MNTGLMIRNGRITQNAKRQGPNKASDPSTCLGLSRRPLRYRIRGDYNVTWLGWSDVDFHPQDPYFVVGCFQTGDVSEAEVLMDVENELKMELVSAAHDGFAEMTYAQVLRYVKSKCST